MIAVIGDISGIIGTLTDDERTVMRALARVRKTKNNIFHENSLSRKRACFRINIEVVLHGLANKTLITPVKNRVWQTTSLGRAVEHALEQIDFDETFGFPITRNRGFP